MSEEPVAPSPPQGPRYCPVCGTQVAERATTCLICGASLTEEVAQVEEQEPRQRPRWTFWLALVGVAAVILAVASVLLQPFVFPAVPTSTPTVVPTLTPHPTVTRPPTMTPTITPTPTPLPPRAHQVREGETLSSIAELYDTTADEILALNPGITPQLLQVGQVLLIPPAVPTPTPEVNLEEVTPLPGNFIVHVVAPDETLSSIAERYGISIDLIRAANPDIPAGSDVIQVNQSLIIPLGTPQPTVVPTPNPNATPTPLPLYPPPLLLGPPDGAVFGGPEAVVVLEWASVGVLRRGEWYEVHVARAGAEPVVERTQATAFRVPAELYPPPGILPHELRWSVRVVREVRGTDTFEPASEPGPVRVFFWLEAPPTPTASPTP